MGKQCTGLSNRRPEFESSIKHLSVAFIVASVVYRMKINITLATILVPLYETAAAILAPKGVKFQKTPASKRGGTLTTNANMARVRGRG